MDFAGLKAAVKAIVFPIGEPENLVAIHNAYIVDGLNTIQQYVKCFREKNTNLIAFPDTRFNCGMTVTSAPDGIIARVYTVGEDFCCKVDYKRSTLATMKYEQAMHQIDFGSNPAPLQTNKPVLDLGDRFADKSGDNALSLDRAMTGFWAIEGCRLYVWPAIESTEDLVVEWSGVKDTYAEEDIIFDGTPLLQKAVRFFLQREIARDLEQDDSKFNKYGGDFNLALADLFWRCRQKLEGSYAEEDRQPVITNGCLVPQASALSPVNPVTVPPTNPWLFRFAILGNYAGRTGNNNLVANLVDSWAPDFVVTAGGNSNGQDIGGNLDIVVGKNYHQYINPYVGAFGVGAADRNRFWPCADATDSADASQTAAFKAFFPLPATAGSKLYYDHIEGPVHLFFLDTADAGGIRSTDPMGSWLKVRLANSPCKYRIVLCYLAPYSSTGNTVPLIWPFKAWGATVVVSAGVLGYERLVHDGLDFIVNGAGGDGGITEVPGPGSQFNLFATTGAQLVTVTCDSVTMEYWSTDIFNGGLQDTLLIQ